MQRQARTQVYHLVGASLCFPTRWRLADKIGRPLNTIHAPIPGYAEQLATTMDKFFDRLKVDKPVWRLNWSLMDDPTLFQPTRDGRKHAAITPEKNAGDSLWLRIERQTLRRLTAHPRYPVHHPRSCQAPRSTRQPAGPRRPAGRGPARPPAVCPAV